MGAWQGPSGSVAGALWARRSGPLSYRRPSKRVKVLSEASS